MGNYIQIAKSNNGVFNVSKILKCKIDLKLKVISMNKTKS